MNELGCRQLLGAVSGTEVDISPGGSTWSGFVIPPPPPAVDASCHTHVCWHRVHEARQRHWVRHHYWRWARAHLSSSTKGMLFRLRMCESTGNYRATNGSHWGAYQYSWGPGSAGDRAGFEVRPDYASPAEQDVRTARFYPSHRGEWACSG